jgi:arginine/lysine/ornithine decarboxylase
MIDELLAYSENIYPLHMPGHKLGQLKAINMGDLYKIDTTEVRGTDNLFLPNGIIKEGMEKAREVYGTLETFFLVNGSSCGILTAISSCCEKGSQIVIGRNSHHSVYNGIYLNELEAMYIYPEMLEESQMSGGINPDLIEKMLSDNCNNISCVVVTSPTYEGLVLDIETIAQIVHKYNKILIVDEAHGAHFNYSNFFPKSALEWGADIVIQSLHKTLPAFTQSALLHVNSARVNVEKIKRYLKIYQTSSPSYILMSGIDETINLSKHGELFEKFEKNLCNFRQQVLEIENIRLVGKEVIGKAYVKDIDLSKLLIIGRNRQISGNRLENILRDSFQIQVEMSTINSVLGITTIADDEDAFNRILKALKTINYDKCEIELESLSIMQPIERKMLISEGINSEAKWVQLSESIGKICGEYIMLYPPSIPLLVPGEVINQAAINLIYKYKEHNLTVHGVEENKIKVIK